MYGHIKNVTLTNVNIENSGSDSAPLVSLNNSEEAIIENCTTQGVLNSSSGYCAGICSYNCGMIKKCINKTEVTIDGQEGGGILANNVSGASVIECGNEAQIVAGKTHAGGISAYNYGTIEKCYNKGNIKSLYGCGGIVGSNGTSGKSGIIEYSYNLADLETIGKSSGSGVDLGGIVGINWQGSSVSYCYTSGMLTNSGNGSVGYGLIVGRQENSNSKLLYSYGTPYNNRPIIGKRSAGTQTGCETYEISEIASWNQDTINEKLTDNFKKDKDNKNEGLPILDWQV